MSARISQALRANEQAKRSAQAPSAPTKPTRTKVSSRWLIESPVGQSDGRLISEADFASVDIFKSTTDRAGFLVHQGYRDGRSIEVIELSAEQVRETAPDLYR